MKKIGVNLVWLVWNKVLDALFGPPEDITYESTTRNKERND
jgi:hypothetical protein